MQVKIRLQRFGAKKRPYYRIVAATESKKRDGNFLEIVGLYHPLSPEDQQVKLYKEKINTWLEKGALPTDTVKSILKKDGEWNALFEKREAKRKAKQEKRNQVRAKKGK